MIILNKLLIPLVAFFALTHLALAQNASGEKIKIDFVSKQMGVPVEGTFGKAIASVNFDKANAAASKAEIDIELASIDTGSDEANTEVKREGWFDVEKFSDGEICFDGGKRCWQRPL